MVGQKLTMSDCAKIERVCELLVQGNSDIFFQEISFTEIQWLKSLPYWGVDSQYNY